MCVITRPVADVDIPHGKTALGIKRESQPAGGGGGLGGWGRKDENKVYKNEVPFLMSIYNMFFLPQPRERY